MGPLYVCSNTSTFDSKDLTIIKITKNRFIFFLASACSKNLVENVTDDQLTASSFYKNDDDTKSYSAEKARLSSSTGWSTYHSETNPWIQVLVN